MHPQNGFLLREAIDSIADFFSVQAASKGLELAVRYGIDVPRRVTGKQQMLGSILAPLLLNAIRYTNQGHVLINVEHLAGAAQSQPLLITIEDTGIGIDCEHLRDLFADAPREAGGGLDFVRRTVADLGGRIAATSHDGIGSMFSVRLPFQAVDTQADVAAGDPSGSGPSPVLGGRSLLVVSAKSIVRRAWHDQLRSLGARVSTAADIDVAIGFLEEAIAEDDPFDGVFVDESCLRSLELTSEVLRLAHKGDVPTIALCEAAGGRSAAELDALGFAARLAKPASASRIAEVMSLVLKPQLSA